jgi:hypothetical protein
MKTYDIRFSDNSDSNNKGFQMSLDDAKSYIEQHNGSGHSYFADYKGGTVSVICNETGETVYETTVL